MLTGIKQRIMAEAMEEKLAETMQEAAECVMEHDDSTALEDPRRNNENSSRSVA